MRTSTRKLMKLLGYTKLYPPQEKAIKAGVEYGENLLVATPTASGKTFIAATAIVNRLKDTKGIAVYLSPLRSITLEKYEYFSVLKHFNIKTRLLIGDMTLGPIHFDLLLTTYEKFDATIRVNPSLLETVSLVVIDEVHYLGDPKRGVTLESIVARLLSLKNKPQIVALSATVPNAEEIASWLNAKLIIDEWRPVPLREAIEKNYTLFYPLNKEQEPIERKTSIEYLDTALKYIEQDGQVLIFSQSRRRVVSLAKKTAKNFRYLKYDREKAKKYARRILETQGPSSIKEELSKLIARGVAYHHAGLSTQQRKIIENAFRENAIAIIHATPTLAAGVNLPARAVIVEEYYRFDQGMRKPIRVFEFKQLSGRAGRPGYDDIGEAIIISSPRDSIEDLSSYYINSTPEPVTSKLEGLQGLRHLILGLVATSSIENKRELEIYLKNTLYARQQPLELLEPLLDKALRDLYSWNLIEIEHNEITPTLLGIELAKTYLDPYSIVILENIFSQAQEITENIALYTISSLPDMTKLPVSRKEGEKLLDKIIDEAPELVDILSWFGPEEARAIKIFFVLKAWINEENEDYIHEEFGIGPGDLYNIIENATWISSGIARISKFIDYRELEPLFRNLETRLKYGIRPELIPLIVIPGIGRVRARRLYNAGFKTITDLATAPVEKLLAIKGLGPAIVKDILDFLGRGHEAKQVKERKIRNLEDYL